MAANEESVKPQTQLFIPGQRKDLYHVVQGKGRNRHWRKFGAGFVNKDGSINVVIDLFPNSHFQLRDPNARDLEEEAVEALKTESAEATATPAEPEVTNGNGKAKTSKKAK